MDGKHSRRRLSNEELKEHLGVIVIIASVILFITVCVITFINPWLLLNLLFGGLVVAAIAVVVSFIACGAYEFLSWMVNELREDN